MRQGQNAMEVIERVKAKIKEIEPGLPSGVAIVPIYDRSDLIQRAIGNMKSTLVEVLITVSLVILIFLWHFPSAIIPVITIPVAVLISFIPFRMMGVTANIMSLGGIIIAVGALVDAAIVVVEQVHKKLEKWHQSGRLENYQEVVVKAVKEVAGPSFFALLVIAVAFLPVLSLESVEGRMFKPLAYTKNLSMLVAAVLAITLDPALRLLFTHMQNFNFRPPWLCRLTNSMLVGTIHPEEKHPISRRLIRFYEPLVIWSLRRKWWVIGGAVGLMLLTIPAYTHLGSEFMPPLEEGAILYMPSTMPGISIGEAQKVLQVTDRIIKGFPEVDRVLGKAGRAETSTDPAPVSMLETLITLKPKSQWRPHLTQEKLITEMNEALTLPGLSNAWTMPIKGRIEMLSTGLRTPIGIKISGANLKTIEEIGSHIESLLPSVKGTRNVFAERTGSGYFLDFAWNREALARYGLSIDEVQDVMQNAIGGENVTTTVEGRERYTVNVRYQRDFRSDFSALERILVPAADGKRQIPLGQLASIKVASGPAMIRNEDGLLTGYVYIDIAGRDPNGYVEDAAQVLKDKVKLPPGYAISWSGQYEAAQRVKQRLLLVVPLTLFLIFLLLYMNTRSIPKTMLIILAVPFSAVGAIWFLFLLGYNLSIAVWVGLIALLGVDAETGIFMLLYLDLAYAQAKAEGRLKTLPQLHSAIIDGAAKRIRPKFMTAATLLLGLIPIMWATGAGADVMKRIAAPMIGGIFTSFLMELMVYPAIYEIWKWNFELKKEH
ncbi:MAG: CusA/CzcA family heavy metal efflux RND transporter, partial [Syntrophobacterales bacterium]|jgi:Cu(I)/Ag(I) efflux system membrane protein CusA/SilA|nr:CusA/CzcA family heavy metal efflux RND transporter [Syntrophobacterales bacterium]